MTEPSRREMELHNAARLHQQRRLKQNTQFSHKDSADLLPLDGFRKLEAQPPYSLQKRLLETHLSKLRSDPHAPLTASSTTEPAQLTSAQLASTQHTQAPNSGTPSPTPTPTPTPETLTPTSETIGAPSLEILTAVHETIALLPKAVVPTLETLSLVVETKAATAVPLSPVLESQSSREEREEAATREEGGGGAPAHDSLRVRCKCAGGDATAALCTTRAANLVSRACTKRLRLQDWGEEERGGPRSARPGGATALIGGLLLQLGGRTLRCSAWVIDDDDSTDLQLGLETLRDLQVSIDLERDCLVVGGEVKEEIPFIKES
uniref:Nuclear receptor-interacting protein 3-like isoform X2 n=1 Tax=Petromyzon marinus TaxID=7757 RepID=A0AAJ7STK8_PETMA|nr:nuclear receptor-interacting protein 3-like isoform X2 [Petromyzon marinus]